jgi:transaldolase
MTISIENLKIKIFADGADLNGMLEMHEKPYIKGLTTNPTLMRKAGISDYKSFAIEVLSQIKEKPISFEVFSDELAEMKRQAMEISSWGENVYVKIPITNTKGESTKSVVRVLVEKGIKVNVTAIFTPEQVRDVVAELDPSVSSFISVFAGRIADTGRDPITVMGESLQLISDCASAELIWASPRELLNVFQAAEIGCHIITATSDILNKLTLVGKDLTDYSLETVKMFHTDALNAGFSLHSDSPNE